MRGMEPLIEYPPAPRIVSSLSTAQDPDTDSQALWQLIEDPNDTVANTSRLRLGLTLRPLTPAIIPVIDPATGRVVQ